MDFKEYTDLICKRIREILPADYPVFSGNIPLGLRNAVSVNIKSAVTGNRSCIISFTITLRSGEHALLLSDAGELRRKISGNFNDTTVVEVPEQDFSIEGVKGEFYWLWQTGFDIRVFNADRKGA